MPAENQHEPAPWDANRSPAGAFNPQAPQPGFPPQPGFSPQPNPYEQAGGNYAQPYQPYGGPGYGQNPLYGQQTYPQPGYAQPGYAQPYNPAQYTQPFGGSQYMKPHRGVAVLVLAVLTWVFSCPITGFIAFFMAKKDLEEMNQGQMDPAGKTMTQIGYWIGIVTACFFSLIYLGYFIFIVVMVAANP